MSQEEPSDRKPDPWPLWMAGHAQLKFVMTECSKTQIRLTGLIITNVPAMRWSDKGWYGVETRKWSLSNFEFWYILVTFNIFHGNISMYCKVKMQHGTFCPLIFIPYMLRLTLERNKTRPAHANNFGSINRSSDREIFNWPCSWKKCYGVE